LTSVLPKPAVTWMVVAADAMPIKLKHRSSTIEKALILDWPYVPRYVC
jgi:hypothetical protein